MKTIHLLRIVLFVACTASLVACTASNTGLDSSIETSSFSVDSKVINGSAYDKAVVPLGNCTKAVFLNGTRIQRTKSGGDLHLYMKKTLGFAGHPGKTVSIADTRNQMDCAEKREKGSLFIMTFGDWDSHIEGGASIELLAQVPEEITVVVLPPEPPHEHAWRTEFPGPPWSKIPSTPDFDKTAK